VCNVAVGAVVAALKVHCKQRYHFMFNLDFSVHALWGGDHRPALYDWQTRTVWPKAIKIKNYCGNKDTYGCPWGKL